MAKKTWLVSEAIEKIQNEMDTQEETFVNQNEYIDYINDGIDFAEAEIHNLYEGYFNTSSTINIVSGTAAYALPLSMYANKIRHVTYKKNSNDFYAVPRIRLQEIAAFEEQSGNDYRYDIQNDGTATGAQIVLYPTPTENVTAGIKLWYLRNAERVALTTDLIDIPEFASVVFAFVKYRIASKELSPLLSQYEGELSQQTDQMKRTLSEMIPDEDQKIHLDLSFYDDFNNRVYGYE